MSPEPVQQAGVLALGACNEACVGVLVEELQPLLEEPAPDRAKVGALLLHVPHLLPSLNSRHRGPRD